jgi:hypothetical protein
MAITLVTKGNPINPWGIVAKFAICFLPLSVTAGLQPSQAAAAGSMFCCCREKSVVRVGSIKFQ